MLINTKAVILSGIRLMSSTNTYRITLDLPEGVNLADIDELLRKSLTLNLVSDEVMKELQNKIKADE